MMTYKNRMDSSCVYDAFEQAGILPYRKMLYGFTYEDTLRILDENNWKIFRKGEVAPIDKASGFIIIYWLETGQLHAEYHVSTEEVYSYDTEKICAIAMK